MSYINMATQDVLDYYNENNLIPGVELELLKYDTQYLNARFVFGYEWLRERNVDFIWNSPPPGVPVLKTRADKDKYPILSATANIDPEELDNSYVFCVGITPTYEAYTLLDWLAKNDPDFPKDRPARIGGAAWREAYSDIWFKAAEEYCKENPQQYEWVEGYLTDVKFNWDTEIYGLRDCDYVYVPITIHTFAKPYRDAGYKAKFIGTDVHTAFLGMLDATNTWKDVDGMLFVLSEGWYNDKDDPIIDFINELLEENYSEKKIEEIKSSGVGYRAAFRIHMICDIVRKTVENVGADNFDSDALVETAKSWSFDYGDVEGFCNFTQSKRFSQNYYAIYEAQHNPDNPKSWQYLTRIVRDWIPQITEP